MRLAFGFNRRHSRLSKASRRGGRLWLDDDCRLRARLPKKNLEQLTKLLKDRRASILHHVLAARPKILIPVACGCSAKPHSHLIHDHPKGDEQPEIRVRGGFKELREALIRCQSHPEGWEMGDLIQYMEEAVKTEK